MTPRFRAFVACAKCGEQLGEAASMQESRDITDLHRMMAHDEIPVTA